MSEIKVFENSEFGRLQIITIEGKEYFPATECAEILGYKRGRDAISSHCRGAVKYRSNENGILRDKMYIPEGDLYRLIIRSKLPSAERFEKWVFEEILPTIRRHGAYLSPEKVEEVLADPDTIIRLATQLKEERAAKKALEEKVRLDAPKVRFAESVSASADTILISDLAKLLKQNGLDIGRDRLFAKLRADGYLCSSFSEKNMPTQYSMNLGLFEVDERTWRDPYGVVHSNFTTRVTGKGQQYFIRKYIING